MTGGRGGVKQIISILDGNGREKVMLDGNEREKDGNTGWETREWERWVMWSRATERHAGWEGKREELHWMGMEGRKKKILDGNG